MKSIQDMNIAHYKNKNYSNVQEECWTSDFEVHESCPYHKEQTLIISQSDYGKILALDKEFTTEFSIYFDVEVIDKDKGIFKMTNIIIPKQIVTTATIDFVDNIHCAGVLHKHPKGVTTFSHTDDTYININHDFSILLEAGEIRTAVGRIRTPCNHVLKTDVKVEIEVSDIEEHAELIAHAKTMITEPAYTYPSYTKKKGQGGIIIDERDGYRYGIECVECGKEITKKKKYRECEECGEPMCLRCATINERLCTTCTRREHRNEIRDECGMLDEYLPREGLEYT